MFQKLIAKMIFKAIYNAIKKKHDLKKIDDYVNKENDADRMIKDLSDQIKELKENSHPPIFKEQDQKDMIRRIRNLEKKIRKIKS